MGSQAGWRLEAALLFVVAIWGANFVVVKAVLPLMHPHALNLIRFAFSTAVLGGLYVAEQRRRGQPLLEPLRRHFWAILALGLLGYVFYQLCFILGLDRTTAGNAALIMASAPVWTAIVARLFGYEVLSLRAWVGLMVALLGTVLVIVGGPQEVDLGGSTLAGNLIILGAAVFWGAYTAFNKPLLASVSPTGLAFLGLLFGYPILIALGLPHLDAVAWERVTGWTWLALVYSGGLSTGWSIVLWNWAVQQVGPSSTAVYGNLVPFVAVFTGALFLHEPVTLLQVGGGGVLLAGMLLLRRARHLAVVASNA